MGIIKNWKQYNESTANDYLVTKFGWNEKQKDAYDYLTGLGWEIDVDFGGAIDSIIEPDGEEYVDYNTSDYTPEVIDAIVIITSIGEDE